MESEIILRTVGLTKEGVIGELARLIKRPL